jgi:tetratricopeptide (TPR) repeat protein
MNRKKFVIVILILGLAVYFNATLNGFVWDDEELIVNNTLIHSIKNWQKFFFGGAFYSGGTGKLLGSYYKPLMTLAFSLLYSLFGAKPFFFHLLSLLIHITNSVLVYLLFEQLFGKLKKGFLAKSLSLFFLVHPIYSEVVLYASDMQDVFYFLFGMIGLLLTIKSKLINPRHLILVFLAFFLSLLSKETAILFIIAGFLYLFFFQKEKLKRYSFAAILSIGAYLFLRFAIASIPLTRYEIPPIAKAHFTQRLISIPKIIFYYLQTLVLPYNLAVNQHWVVQSINFKDFFLPFIFVFLFFAFFVFRIFSLVRTHKKTYLLYLFFFLWFTVSLFAHVQIFPLDVTVSGRWFYTPMVGLLGILGLELTHLNLLETKKSRKILTLVFFLFLTALSLRTFLRTFDFRSGLTLYSKDIFFSRQNYNLENNLGVELFRKGKINKAKLHFEKSVNLNPDWWTNWNNLGVIYEQEGKLDKAEEAYKKAVENGGYYLAYENLANLYFFKKKDIKAAKKFSKDALTTLPYNFRLWFILALAEYEMGNKSKALVAAKNAYLLNPNKNTFYVYSQLLKGKKLKLDY